MPEGVDDAAVRQRLLQDYNLEIGAGLGDFAGKVWRIGLMGYASREQNVLYCLNALERILSEAGVNPQPGGAAAAASAVYASSTAAASAVS